MHHVSLPPYIHVIWGQWQACNLNRSHNDVVMHVSCGNNMVGSFSLLDKKTQKEYDYFECFLPCGRLIQGNTEKKAFILQKVQRDDF